MTTAHRLPFGEVENLLGKMKTAMAHHPGKPRPRFSTSRMTCVYEDPADWRVPRGAPRGGGGGFFGRFPKKNARGNTVFPAHQPAATGDTAGYRNQCATSLT